MILLRLFLEFAKVGLFSIGGGLATIPFLYELSEKTGWYTASQLADMIAISESTPGPIGIKMASYIGFTKAGVLGCISAVTGIVFPSLIIIIIIASFLKKFRTNDYVDAAFSGLRPASLGLISAAALGVAKITFLNLPYTDIVSLFNYKCIILAVAVFFAMRKFKGHPIYYILASAVIGIVLKF